MNTECEGNCMKKLTCLGIIFMIALSFCPVAFATYDGEILFRDIPWDTDIVSFNDQIISEIHPDDYFSLKGISTRRYVDYFDDSYDDPFMYYTFKNEVDYAFDVLISADDGILVAAWPLSFVTANAIHNVENGIVLRDPLESRIINCTYHFDLDRIDDGNLALQDLKDKLVSTYGDIWRTIENDDGLYITEHIWLGDNTYVALRATSHPESNELIFLKLEYGITNAIDLLKRIENPESTIDLSSTEGL